jgi:hypothetical protein
VGGESLHFLVPPVDVVVFLFRLSLQKSKKHQRCPDCNAPATVDDMLRLFANLGSISTNYNNNNDNSNVNNDVCNQRNEHLESLTVELETRLHAVMKDKYANNNTDDDDSVLIVLSEKLKRDVREVAVARERASKLQAERDLAVQAELQLRLSTATLRVELDQMRVRLAHAATADTGAASKRARTTAAAGDADDDDEDLLLLQNIQSTATSSSTLSSSTATLNGRALRVRVAPELDNVVVVACGNSRGRFDFVKLDALQLQYGSTIADVHQHRVRDLRLLGALPGGPFAERMILSAGGRALQLTSLRSNTVAMTIHLQTHGWSCVSLADFGLPTVLACGVQDGSVALYDVRMPQATLLHLAAAGAGRGQPLFALDAVHAADTGAPWLIGANAGRLSSWQIDTSGGSGARMVCSFAPVAWPDNRKCRSGAAAGATLLTSHQVGDSESAVQYEHRLMQGFVPNRWPPECEAVFSSASGVAAVGDDQKSLMVCHDAAGGRQASRGSEFALVVVERGQPVGRVDLERPANGAATVSASNVVDMHLWASATSNVRCTAAIAAGGLALWRETRQD